jgi:hypothetical protein
MMDPVDRLTQDFIVIGGDVSPGRARIKGAGSPRTWDVRQGYGFSGAWVIFTGAGLAKFEVEIALWQDAQRQAWEGFAKKYLEKAPSGTRPKALGIYHPLLAASPLNISAVVVEDVSQFEEDDFGLWTCVIKFLEYRQPKPILARPSSAIPAAGQALPTARDALDQEILRKQQELAKLAGGA